MSAAQRPGDVRRLSIRVALVATGLVAAIYFVLAVSVFAIVSGNLTAQVDARLRDTLQKGGIRQIPSQDPASGIDPGGLNFQPPKGDRGDFGPGLLIWTNGGLTSAPGMADLASTFLVLPDAYLAVSDPVTVNIGGEELRLVGARKEIGYIVVGQSLGTVGQAQSTLVLAELVLGPVLLSLIFLGSVAIGRRVATPIETMRRRQLEFTADASHELRTPLSVVEAHTSLALTQDRSADWYRSAFGRIDRESKRMRRLLDDLLWLARFDAAQGAPNAEPVDLAILAAQAADRFGAVAEARQLALAVRASGGGLVVTAPPEWLDRLLGVLIDNACKYASDAGSVDVLVAGEAGRVTLTVDDSGLGIPEEERSMIFDRFHRATASGTGAGLGLAIGDEIVRATGGRWKVGVSPAGGARLQVTWKSATASGPAAVGSVDMVASAPAPAETPARGAAETPARGAAETPARGAAGG